MKISIIYIFGGLLTFLSGCTPTLNQKALDERIVGNVVNQMTSVMVHDVTNPPLASRFYAYACLAGYEVLAQNNRNVHSMKEVLNDYPLIRKPVGLKEYDVNLSAVLAMYRTAEAMQPSGFLLRKFETLFIDSCRSMGTSDTMISRSLSYAQFISKSVLAYAKADHYNKISNFRRYTPTDQNGRWNPTPPSYLSPVEPYFNTVRPFTLDSASQFFIADPIPFSSKKGSDFYDLMIKNYKKGARDLTRKEMEIANFWDCNPFAVQVTGHMLIGLKKISPGAHWMGIATLACNQEKTGFIKAVQVHTLLAIGIADGFISCWDSKYKTDRIRPETAIRKYIDPSWKPFLQTPPFPEYLSGHSVISAVSAEILTAFFGKSFYYTDDVEQPYGVSPRSFKSFNDAASEAADSRFYGGIHFVDAVKNGVVQGHSIGQWVMKKCLPVSSDL